MAELVWLGIGFLLGTFFWNEKFRNWIKTKLGRKPKPVVEDKQATIVRKQPVVQEIKRVHPRQVVKKVTTVTEEVEEEKGIKEV